MQSILTCPPVPKGPRAALGSSRRRGSPQGRDHSGRRPSIFRPFGAPAAGTRTAPPRVAFPRRVCSLAPATEIIKQKNFCKLSSPNTRGFHKSGPPLLRTCIQSSRKAGVGRWCAVEGTPKFPGRPWVSRRARRAPVPWQALSGFPSPGTLSPRSFPGDAARPSEGAEVGSNFRGLCGLTKPRFWSPHPRGPRGNSSEGRFLRAGKVERGGGGRIGSCSSPGAERCVWGCGEVRTQRWSSPIPTGAADSAPPRAPLNGARDRRWVHSPTPPTRRLPSPR